LGRCLFLYDDLREDDCESYPLSVPAGSLQRVIRWVVQIGETRFPLLARAIEGQVTADLADDVLDAYKACLRVLDVIDSASKTFGTSPVATSAAFGGSRGGR
jgi:DNA-binding transcriptional regulator YdaS (Cro superfamily)